jgi:hypothetical protein
MCPPCSLHAKGLDEVDPAGSPGGQEARQRRHGHEGEGHGGEREGVRAVSPASQRGNRGGRDSGVMVTGGSGPAVICGEIHAVPHAVQHAARGVQCDDSRRLHGEVSSRAATSVG